MVKDYYRRVFLNPKKGVALIECSINTWGETLSGSVKITDCNRTVSLEFENLTTDKNNKKKLETKLNTLITELQNFKKALLD